MTVFRKSVSWSKYKMMVTCPRMLQNVLDKKYSPTFGIKSRASRMGKLVQRVFEVYFEHRLHLNPRGRDPQVLVRLLRKVMEDKWAADEGITEDMFAEAVPQIVRGYEIFCGLRVLDMDIRSERKVMGAYMGFPLFGMVDFEVRPSNGGIHLYDGKGNARKDAEPEQLLFYGLIYHAAKVRLLSAGFIYWKHDYEPVDVTPRALYEFVNSEEFRVASDHFRQLRTGVDVLPTTPSKENCYWCDWRKVCEDSAFLREPAEVFSGVQEISLGEVVRGEKVRSSE